MSTQTIGWIQPAIESQIISANKMQMTVDFKDGTGLKNVTITRVGNEFYAEEAGFYCRKFVDAEVLRWEFEYPESLVAQLNAMPSGDDAPNTYMNFDAMDKHFADYVSTTPNTATQPGPIGNTISPKTVGGLGDLMMMGLYNEVMKKRGTNMTPKKKKRKKRRK